MSDAATRRGHTTIQASGRGRSRLQPRVAAALGRRAAAARARAAAATARAAAAAAVPREARDGARILLEGLRAAARRARARADAVARRAVAVAVAASAAIARAAVARADAAGRTAAAAAAADAAAADAVAALGDAARRVLAAGGDAALVRGRRACAHKSQNRQAEEELRDRHGGGRGGAEEATGAPRRPEGREPEPRAGSQSRAVAPSSLGLPTGRAVRCQRPRDATRRARPW